MRRGLENSRWRLRGLLFNMGRLESFCFRGQLVVLSGQQVVQIAYCLEKDIEPCFPLDRPENTTVLEPGVGKYAMQPAEHIDEILDAKILTMIVVVNNKPAREDLLVGYNVGSPVQGMTAVVDGAATLGLLMHSTEELPFGSAHLRARVRTTWWGVEEEANDQ